MSKLMKSLSKYLTEHKSGILLATSLTGFFVTGIFLVKGTIKATRLVDERLRWEEKEKLTVKETIQTVWKCYIPAAIGTVVSTVCAIEGNRSIEKQNAILATACSISEQALQEYQEKTKEIVGEKKAQEIHESLTNDQVGKTYDQANTIYLTGEGDSLFYEPITTRYFKSNWNKILKTANDLNQSALRGSSYDELTFNEWLSALGLDSSEIGDDLGWSTEDGLIDISIDSHLTSDNIPCGAIFYNKRPRYLR